MGGDDGIFQYFPSGMRESYNIYLSKNDGKYFEEFSIIQDGLMCFALDVGKYFPVLVMELSIIGTGKFLKFDEIPTAFLTDCLSRTQKWPVVGSSFYC